MSKKQFIEIDFRARVLRNGQPVCLHETVKTKFSPDTVRRDDTDVVVREESARLRKEWGVSTVVSVIRNQQPNKSWCSLTEAYT